MSAVNNQDTYFSLLIDDLRLVNLGFSGSCFTWSRGNDAHTFKGARLDRALCSMNCMLMSLNSLKSTAREYLCHSAIAVQYYSNLL